MARPEHPYLGNQFILTREMSLTRRAYVDTGRVKVLFDNLTHVKGN